MRKLIVCNIISLDGYYSGPNHDVMAMPFDDAFDDYNAERLRAADTLLLGRRSFEGFKGYWPPVAEDPNVRPVEREISRLNNAIELHLMIGPALLGGGIPLFEAGSRQALRLLDARRLDGSQLLLARYRPSDDRPS